MASVFSVRDVPLTKDTLNPECILNGNPDVFSAILSTSNDGKIIRGVWKITEGTVTDTEQDEMFTIIEGKATVHVEGQNPLELFPGVCGFFKFGNKTTWVIKETILKTFQITLQDETLKNQNNAEAKF